MSEKATIPQCGLIAKQRLDPVGIEAGDSTGAR